MAITWMKIVNYNYIKKVCKSLSKSLLAVSENALTTWQIMTFTCRLFNLMNALFFSVRGLNNNNLRYLPPGFWSLKQAALNREGLYYLCRYKWRHCVCKLKQKCPDILFLGILPSPPFVDKMAMLADQNMKKNMTFSRIYSLCTL